MEKCKNISDSEWEIIFRAAQLAEGFHLGEIRKVSRMPYITHPIEIVLEYISQESYPNWKNITVLILHDTLESHPERWQEVFDIVPLDIFCRIVKLSKLPSNAREEIQESLFDHLSSLEESEA